MGRDRRPRTARRGPDCFNPRARVGRDPRGRMRPPGSRCFNPRARVGRDAVAEALLQSSQVSIHAPAWGATADGAGRLDAAGVSIHAPAWGATSARWPTRSGSKGFNPRARVGRDLTSTRMAMACVKFQSTRPRGARRVGGSLLHNACHVSIHAPAWGATVS